MIMIAGAETEGCGAFLNMRDSWAAFGPANHLPARLFSNIDWNDPRQAESWAIVVGSEFVHSLWSHRGRFSQEVLDHIKGQCTLFLYGDSEKLVAARFPPQLIEIAKRLDNTVDKITFERNMADLRKPQAKTIVLKRLKNIKDNARRTRFAQEVKATQSIEHPNVLKIIDKNLDAERPYFVAELCEQGSLEKAGAARYRGDVRSAVEVLLPVVNGGLTFRKQAEWWLTTLRKC